MSLKRVCSTFESLRSAALFLTVVVVAFPGPAAAVVTTTARTVSYSPTSGTSVFSVTFPFTAKNQIKVVENYEPTDTDTTLTQGSGYTVIIGLGLNNGIVTTDTSYGGDYTITISRVTPLTQTIRFTTQGQYNPGVHENVADKLTFLIQETRAAAGTSGDDAVETHVGQSDPHDQYAILAGRASGQHLEGGTASGENLQLSSTHHATKGKVIIGSNGTALVVDDDTGWVGIGTATPTTPFYVNAAATINSVYTASILGGTASGADLWLNSTSHGTDGDIKLGTDTGAGPVLSVDDLNNRVGVLTVAPDVEFDVVGDVELGSETWQLTLGSDYIDMTTTDVTASLLLGASDGTTGGMTGLLLHPPDHATLAGQMFLYGSTINFLDDPLDSVHSYITEAAVYFKGTARFRNILVTAGIAEAVADADCNTTYLAPTNNTILQLQNAASANEGCQITLVNTQGAGGVVNLSPHNTDSIWGTCNTAAADRVMSGAANTDVINKTGVSQKGDSITVISDGSSAWWITSCTSDWNN